MSKAVKRDHPRRHATIVIAWFMAESVGAELVLVAIRRMTR
jgi:hypothetical protein